MGVHGFAVVYAGQKPGPTTIVRAELDALPIRELNDVDYVSATEGVAHLCGHDGHMAILVGLGEHLSQHRPLKGKVVLLFQPAEETGQGASEVISDQAFKEIVPDYIFALHNVPGFEKHRILIKNEAYTAASKGMTICLTGRTSHAAEPEKGISPALAMAEIIKALEFVSGQSTVQYDEKVLVTVVHALLGEIAFGTTPGYAEIRATLRTATNEGLDKLNQWAKKLVVEIAKANKLTVTITYCEYFPATVNDASSNDLIRKAAKKSGYPVAELMEPFKWSEDFGFYTKAYKGALFGLGSGLEQPPLHHPGYDFPDELIATGMNVFEEIIKKINY